jgi:hypothetical protein
MSFETLILEPAAGNVDLGAVRKWLDDAPFAERVEPDIWQLCATARLAVMARLDREDGRSGGHPVGVTIWADADRVGMIAYADVGAMARARDFVRWLARQDEWTIKVDRAAPAPLGDPERIFTDDLPATDTLVDDLTVGPVMMGTLTRWGGHGYQIHIHSSGQMRFEAPDRTLSGQVDGEVLKRWNAAVDAVDEDDPELPDDPPEEHALTIEIETPEDTAFAMLDRTDPPASIKAASSLAEPWMKALAAWDGAREIDGLIIHAG